MKSVDISMRWSQSISVLGTTLETLDSTINFPSSTINRPFPTHELFSKSLYLEVPA